MSYDPRSVERRWQERWSKEEVFKARRDDPRPKFYCLEMLPYPSGRLHVGHVRNYALGDAVAWHERLRGKNVFHPIGWDSMGLPAENAAIKNGVAPAKWTLANIEHMRGQLQRLGISYDWDTETTTCLPEYYKWNQWFFLRMLERGLAYRAKRTLNWCPKCATVLAEAQVTPSNCCWRHEDMQVEKVELDQWFVRITDYRDRLLDNLDGLAAEWPERVITAQRDWIGRSHGCRFAFRVDGSDDAIEVFSTRVDTVYGCSAVFIAAGHPLTLRLAAGTPQEAAVRAFVEAETKGPSLPPDEKEKVGVFTGRHAVNPFNGEKVPIWTANFVLAEFGTGAVFAQPAHDQRDFEFAAKYGLAVTPVVRAEGGKLADGAAMDRAYTEQGILENSGPFSGLTTEEARRRMSAYAEEKGFGRAEIQYRLRDWGIARQRYWGTPIPVVYCDHCGIVPVPDDQLPVVLPEVPDWKGQTGSPLAQIKEFVETSCPKCGGAARRETDTMDTFVDSSWYFLRYLDPRNDKAPFDPAAAAHFMPADLYIGGAEHATGHLIYFRFWTMFLKDLGLLPTEEPAKRLFTQGMVRASSYRCPVHDYVRVSEVDTTSGSPRCPKCGAALDVHLDKMSKSKVNDADLDHLVERYGADAVRLAVLFGGPPALDFEWKDSAIEGPHRFVQRVARLFERFAPALGRLPETPADPAAVAADADALKLRKATHHAIARVTRDLEREIQLNTAIAAQMELVNELYRQTEGKDDPDPASPKGAAVAEALHALARLLAPFAPHLAEEMNERLGWPTLIGRRTWPEADPALLVEDEVVLPVQVLGKLRGQVTVPRGAKQDVALAAAQADPNIARHLEGKQLVRVVLVPDRLLNLVVKG
ncbi:MAG TPA: leucine--tRNA ligase [Acidobacteriota bacterium]|nr:leucine--tRNA ligase [Acidobacteriota bacterium]